MPILTLSICLISTTFVIEKLIKSFFVFLRIAPPTVFIALFITSVLVLVTVISPEGLKEILDLVVNIFESFGDFIVSIFEYVPGVIAGNVGFVISIPFFIMSVMIDGVGKMSDGLALYGSINRS